MKKSALFLVLCALFCLNASAASVVQTYTCSGTEYDDNGTSLGIIQTELQVTNPAEALHLLKSKKVLDYKVAGKYFEVDGKQAFSAYMSDDQELINVRALSNNTSLVLSIDQKSIGKPSYLVYGTVQMSSRGMINSAKLDCVSVVSTQ